jgi:hypothetical protein
MEKSGNCHRYDPIIDSLHKATSAMQLIQQQGEGGNRNPFYGGTNLSHFYVFGGLYFAAA